MRRVVIGLVALAAAGQGATVRAAERETPEQAEKERRYHELVADFLLEEMQWHRDDRYRREREAARLAKELGDEQPPPNGPYQHQFGSNFYGVSRDFPIAQYDNSGLVGAVEFLRPDSPAPTFEAEFRLGVPGKTKVTGGWAVEPVGRLTRRVSVRDVTVQSDEVPNTVPVDTYIRTTCEIDVSYHYGDANDGITFETGCRFEREDHTEPATNDVHLTGLERCVEHMTRECQPSGRHPSRDGQTVIEVSPTTATIFAADGTRTEFTGPLDFPIAGPWGTDLGPQNAGGVSGFGQRIDDARMPTRTIDVNGNVTTYERDENQFIRAVIDPRGRVTRYVRAAGSYRIDEIHQPGPGGAPLVWRLRWQRKSWHPQSVGKTPCARCEPTVDFDVITEIEQPDGRSWEMTYGAQTGYLERVREPDGGVTEYGWGTATTPFHRQPALYDMPPLADLLLAQRHVSTTVYPEGLAGPAYVTTFEQDDALALPRGEATQTYGWFDEHSGDFDGDGKPDKTIRELRGDLGVLAREVLGNGTLVEGTYYANIGPQSTVDVAPHCTPKADEASCSADRLCAWADDRCAPADAPALGFTYFDAAVYVNGNASDIVDTRPRRVVHLRDGVKWFEELAYQSFATPGFERAGGPCNPGGTSGLLPSLFRCTAARTTGNVTGHWVFDGSGTLLRATSTRWLADAAYLERNLLRLPTSREITDAAGTVVSRTEFRYDEDRERDLLPSKMAAARRVAVGDARGNATSLVEWASATHSRVTRSRYYDNGALARVAAPKAAGDLAGAYTTVHEDDFGECSDTRRVRRSSVELPLPGHGSAARHRQTVDRDCFTGAVLREVAVDGTATCTRYDALGRVVETAGPGDSLSPGTDGTIAPECVAADAGNGPTTTIRYELALSGKQSKPREQRTVTTSKDGGNGLRAIAFVDGLGRSLASCDEVDPSQADGNRFRCSQMTYDGLDRVIESSVPFWVAAAPTSVPDRPAQTRYLARGFDALGRERSVELAGSGLGAIVTNFGADGHRFAVTQTDRDGYDSTAIVDVLGREILREREWVDADEGQSVACSGNWCTTSMTYDAMGRELTVAEDDGQVVTKYVYDWLGRVTSMTDADRGGFADRSWAYTWDDHNNETRRVDPAGNVITFEYDRLDRLVKRTMPSALQGDQAEREVTMHYDGSGPPVPPVPQ